MSVNRGKQWEAKLKEDFSKLPNAWIYRIPDIMSGYKGIKGVCDFIGYCYPCMFLLEAKTTLGNTFVLSALTQYEDLKQVPYYKGLHKGVMIWFQTHDRVLYVPISTIEQMKQDNIKSVNVRLIDSQGYKYCEVPSVKKRVFLDSDYSVLLALPEQGW